jgi:hypothetical protein
MSLARQALGNTLKGNSEANRLTGGSSNDSLMARGSDDILGSSGGIDTTSYADATPGASPSTLRSRARRTQAKGVDTLISFENLTGSAFGDTLRDTTGDKVRRFQAAAASKARWASLPSTDYQWVPGRGSGLCSIQQPMRPEARPSPNETSRIGLYVIPTDEETHDCTP